MVANKRDAVQGPGLQPTSARRRRRWFRRPIPVLLTLVCAAIVVVAGVAGYRSYAALNAVQALSTPPPELSDEALGGTGNLVIDTGPAMEAVRQQAERDRQQESSDAGGRDVAAAPSTELPATGASAPPLADHALAQSSSTVGDDPVNTFPVVNAGSGEATAWPTSQSAANDLSDAGNVPIETTPSPADRPAQTDGVTILLMGVDARDAEAIDVGVRPDALALLHIDAAGSCRMLAIPRDSRVMLPGYGQSKINHALAVGGIPYQLHVVEGYLEVEIDHYGLVDFTGVTDIVDTLGGIAVDNPTAFGIDGEEFGAGPIQLDGKRALLYARYRGGTEGDFGRISRQQQVLRAVLERASEANLVALVPQSFSLLSGHIRTDLGPTDLVSLGSSYLDTCTADSLETSTISGKVSTLPDDLMQMDLSFVVSTGADVREHVDWLFGID